VYALFLFPYSSPLLTSPAACDSKSLAKQLGGYEADESLPRRASTTKSRKAATSQEEFPNVSEQTALRAMELYEKWNITDLRKKAKTMDLPSCILPSFLFPCVVHSLTIAIAGSKKQVALTIAIGEERGEEVKNTLQNLLSKKGNFSADHDSLPSGFYKRTFNTIDLFDKSLATIGYQYRMVGWKKSLFVYFVRVALLNAWTVYSESKQQQQNQQHELSLKCFCMSVADDILKEYS
jgi:hypothetical protein